MQMLCISPSRCLLVSCVHILNNLPSNVCDHLGHCWWCHMSSQASRAEPRPRGDVWTQLTGWDWMRGESCHVIPRVILRGFMSRTWAVSWDRAGTSIYQRQDRSSSYSTADAQLHVPPRAGRLAVASTAPGPDRPLAGPSSQAVCEGWGPGAPGTSTAQCPGSHPAGPSSPVHPGSCAGRSVPSLPLLLGRAPQVRPWPLPLPPGPAAPDGPTGEQAPASLPALPSASA